MKLVYNPHLASHLESFGIKVPLRDDRSQKTFEFLLNEFPTKLELTDISTWKPLTKEELLLVHSPGFVENLFLEESCEKELISCYELYDSRGNPNRYDPASAQKPLKDLVGDILLQGRGTLFSMEEALLNEMVFFLGGGMHHAMEDGGRGFCLVNDIVIGIRSLQKKKKIKNAWVIDTDAHKGDGTASITKNDPSISTLSIHMQKGWPLDIGSGEGPWRTPSSIDIPIAYNKEETYLDELQRGLLKLTGSPEIAIVVAGADPYEKDALPSSQKLRLTKEQMLQRDLLVYEFLKEKKIAQCWLMAGGYGADSYKIYTQFLRKLMREAE